MVSPYQGSEPTDLDRLGKLLAFAHQSTRLTNSLKNRYFGSIRGTVTSVDDPDELGRVLVEPSNTLGYTTQWISIGNGVQGLQPQSLVGSEVLLSPETGDPHKLIVTTVLENDPVEISRLALYEEGELPVCNLENRGYQAVVMTGNNDYLVTCLLRNGVYLWIAPADLSHVHVKSDSVAQRPDSDGSIEQDILNDDHVSLDTVVNTSDKQYDRNSKNFQTQPQFYGGFD